MPPRSRSEPEMLRGSLPQGGRTKTLTLTEDEAAAVAAALARYAAAKAELDARAAAGLSALLARVADRRRRRS